MKIVFLTQWFDPENMFKGLIFVKEIVRQGHQVKVLTGFPNYPTGKLYPGYKLKLFQYEVMDGIPVIRVPLYPSHDKSSFKRIINYASFAISASIIGGILIGKADVIYVYHPPGTIGLPAVLFKTFKSIPFVYDIQDIWPDSVMQSGMVKSNIIEKLISSWSNFIYKKANLITVLSPGFKKLLIERSVPHQKIHVIYNWCDEILTKKVNYDPDFAKKYGFDGKFNVVFAGNIGPAQDADTILDAAKLVAKYNDIQIVFIGGGIDRERIHNKTQAMHLKNVRFIDHQPINVMPKFLAISDALLVHLKDHDLFRITIPSRIQAYLASGRPIIAAISGDAADLVKKSQAGIVCKSGNAQQIADSIINIFNMSAQEREAMGKRGREFYFNHLSIQIGTKKFLNLFKTLNKNNF